MKRRLVAPMLASLFLVTGVGVVSAQRFTEEDQAPPPAKKNVKIPGTSWSGSEDLGNGWGKLTFQFQPNNEVLMIDAKSKVKGTYAQSGKTVKIRFRDCHYTGKIKGNTIAGTAEFTGGQHVGTTWTWSVEQQNSAPAANTAPSALPYPAPLPGPAAGDEEDMVSLGDVSDRTARAA